MPGCNERESVSADYAGFRAGKTEVEQAYAEFSRLMTAFEQDNPLPNGQSWVMGADGKLRSCQDPGEE